MTCSVGTDANVTCFDRRSPSDPLADWYATVALAVGKAHACILQREDGGAHTCVLDADGLATCWGKDTNEYGRGIRPPASARPPSRVSGQARFVKLRGASAVAATRRRRRCRPASRPRPSSRGVPIDDAIDIASGDRVTCAVRKTGVVSCWGQMDDVTRGGPEDMYGTWIFDVRNLRNAVKVGVGDRHACALTSSGSAHCGGSGDVGQLGDGSGGDTPHEVEVVVE